MHFKAVSFLHICTNMNVIIFVFVCVCVLWIKSGDQTAAQFHPRCDAAIVALAEPEMDIGQNKRLRQRT